MIRENLDLAGVPEPTTCWLCKAEIPAGCWHCWRCGHTQMLGEGWEFGMCYIHAFLLAIPEVRVSGDRVCPGCGYDLEHKHQWFCPLCGRMLHWECIEYRGRWGAKCRLKD